VHGARGGGQFALAGKGAERVQRHEPAMADHERVHLELGECRGLAHAAEPQHGPDGGEECVTGHPWRLSTLGCGGQSRQRKALERGFQRPDARELG
jgi:hypothetical protein